MSIIAFYVDKPPTCFNCVYYGSMRLRNLVLSVERDCIGKADSYCSQATITGVWNLAEDTNKNSWFSVV